jgi:hypothetical protein
MRIPCLAAAAATHLLPRSDLRALLRMSAEYRQQIEAELSRELERDTEPCPAPDGAPGPGARLIVDPSSLRHTDADRMARLVALAHTHCPELADAPLSGPARTTIDGRPITLPPKCRGRLRGPLHLLTAADVDEVLERLRADTEPMLSSDRQWPGTIEDDPDDDDDPDETLPAADTPRLETSRTASERLVLSRPDV